MNSYHVIESGCTIQSNEIEYGRLLPRSLAAAIAAAASLHLLSREEGEEEEEGDSFIPIVCSEWMKERK